MNEEHTMNDKRVINGWAFYDWANSAFALVIAVAIFPAYFIGVTDDVVPIFNFSVSNSSLFAFAVSGAYLLVALFSPLLSGIADFGGRKMTFMKFFTVVGSMACVSLFFFEGMEQIHLGVASFMLATIGFSGSLVFYNSYLPVIVSEEHYDRVSAKGFTYGYIGSVILLLFNLLVIQKHEWFGIVDKGIAVRLAFVSVGLWWLGFSMIPFRRLPKDKKMKSEWAWLKNGYKELAVVWRHLRQFKNIKAFLFAFFFYSAGVQTVLYIASVFAKKELDFGTMELILVILVLQIVAIAGAYIFANLSDRRGNKHTIIVMLIIWIIICFLAYSVHGNLEFYLLAGAVGFVMGGIQSLSRSTFSKMLPEEENDKASYFSFYDVLEKISIVVGMFSFGYIENLTGGMRNSMLALTAFFIIGLVVISTITIARPVIPVE